MKEKKFKVKLLALLISVIMLASCGKASTTTDSANQSTNTSTNNNNIASFVITSELITYDEEDEYSAWENQNPNYIKLNGTSASVSGNGVNINNNIVTIKTPGVYVISGKLNDGQIIVDTENKGTVRLVLNGAEINCSNNSPIYVINSSKTLISLPEGTQNKITDGSKFISAGSDEDELKATIYSKDNLTINGDGVLVVNSNYKDAISSNDELRITGGNISITSVDDAIVGKDMVLIKNGTITIDAGGDGIKTTNNTDKNTGFVAISGGKFEIAADTDGIQAETSVLITAGNISITTGEGSKNVVMPSSFMGRPGEKASSSTTTTTDTQSQKGIKASSDITISGGKVNIDSGDDGINSKNTISISGGEVIVSSGDDGIHADAAINITNGKLNISKSYEGIESMVVTVSGGEIYVVSADDGINVNGGNDNSSVNGRPGQNSFAASPNSKLVINGGFVSVDALGDGLDSNGSMYMSDGKVVVSGPTNDGNGAIDYNGTFEMTGGYLIAAGSSGMAEAPSETSSQNSILMYYSNTQGAGTTVRLEDNKGIAIVTFAPQKEYNSIVISSPEIKKGESYTLYANGTTTSNITEVFSSATKITGNAKIVECIIENVITWLTETGVTTQRMGGMGGNKGQFGGRPH